ncbi:MAG: hypothetical protein WAN33_15680 [Candidatus Acidiferrales bacterium]
MISKHEEGRRVGVTENANSSSDAGRTLARLHATVAERQAGSE